LTAELQSLLSLAAPRSTNKPAALKPQERIEGRYHVEHPEDVAWFQKLLTLLEAWESPPKYFSGSFSLLSAPQFRRFPSLYSDWKGECVGNWKDVLDLNATASADKREWSARY